MKITPPSKGAFRALRTAADEDFRIVLLVAATTGVRAGELWALRWRHIDFEHDEMIIGTRVDRFKEEDTTKTEAGRRIVPLGSAIVRALKEWRLRSKHSRDEDLVFPNKQGGYISHDNMLRRQFALLCARAGVAGVNWHGLRHFAISSWIEAGLHPKTIQTFAGHASLETTMDRYGHLFPSEDHKLAMDKIADVLLG